MDQSELRRRHVSLREAQDDEERPLLGDSPQPTLSSSSSASPSPSPSPSSPPRAGTMVTAANVPISFLDVVWQLLGNLWNSLPFVSFFSSASAANTPASFNIDTAVRGRMAGFKILATKPFSDKDSIHLDALKDLWATAFPGESFPSEIAHKRWRDLGFQGDDPRRDFRGVGIFGVQNILFLAKNYPAAFARMADLKNTRTEESYPFAITCLNMTMMLLELFGWGWKSKESTAKTKGTFPTLAGFVFAPQMSDEASIEAFSQCFCLVMQELDQTWTSMKAKYMDFPEVLRRTQEAFEQRVAGFGSYNDLLQHNRTALI